MTRKTRIPLISAIALLVTWFVASVASANPLPSPPPSPPPTTCDECLRRCYSCREQQFRAKVYNHECDRCDSLCKGKESEIKDYCEKKALREEIAEDCEGCEKRCYDCFNHKWMSKEEYGDLYKKKNGCEGCENHKCDSLFPEKYNEHCRVETPKDCGEILQGYQCDTGFDESYLRQRFHIWIPDSYRNECLKEHGLDTRCAETRELASSCKRYLKDYDCITGGWKKAPKDENCVEKWSELDKLYGFIESYCAKPRKAHEEKMEAQRIAQRKAETAELAALCFESYDCKTEDWKWPHVLDERCIGNLRELKELHDFDRKCKKRKQ